MEWESGGILKIKTAVYVTNGCLCKQRFGLFFQQEGVLDDCGFKVPRNFPCNRELIESGGEYAVEGRGYQAEDYNNDNQQGAKRNEQASGQS